MKLLLATGLAVASLVTFVWTYAAVTKHQANALLLDIQQFSSAKEFRETFLRFRQRHGRALKQLDGCAADYCAREMRIFSVPAPLRYRIPSSEISALFQGKNGNVNSVMLTYTTRQPEGISPVVHVQMDACEQSCKGSFHLHPHGRSKELWNGIVELNANASSEERQAALAVDLDCFAALRGCNDIAQMLPAIWKHSGERTIVSRLPSQSDASWDRPEE